MGLTERMRMDDRVAVVTGAGQGIGRAIAVGLAEAGCNVVINARRVSDLDITAAAIEKEDRARARRSLRGYHAQPNADRDSGGEDVDLTFLPGAN